MISTEELEAYANQVQEHARQQHGQYVAALQRANAEAAALRAQVEKLGAKPVSLADEERKGGSRGCSVM